MKAMAAGAWQSSVATTFEHDLKGKKRTLHTAGQSAVDEFDKQIRAEPDMVDSNSFEAHYAKYRTLMR